MADKSQNTEQELDVEEFAAVLHSRSANYGLLSRLFRKEVDEELLEELHNQHYRVSTGNASIDEGNRLLATALSGMWENTVTELAADYMRTFFGHGYSGHAAAYPFESVYTSDKHLLMASARDEVLALYRAAGLEKDESWKEGEDHLALELEYMQILAERTEKALADEGIDATIPLLRKQQNFLDDHLLQWVPLLTEEIKEFAWTDFYKALGYLTEGTLEVDKELLDELLGEEETEGKVEVAEQEEQGDA